METRSPVASSEITCSPGHNFPSDWTPAFASLRVSASSTKCRLPSSRILKMQKRRRIQTPNGDDVLEGQWSNYRINLMCWIQAAASLRKRSSHKRTRQYLLPRFLAVGAFDVGMFNVANPTLNRYRIRPLTVGASQIN